MKEKREHRLLKMSSVGELQKSLAARSEDVRQRDSLILQLEREIRTRDTQIRQMQAELDKFRQILKPMTQQLAQNLSIQALVLDDGDAAKAQPGRDGHATSTSSGGPSLGLSTLGSGLSRAREKVEGVAARMKRIAISAEPTKKAPANPRELNINRIEKSDR